jgi:hypothetical protein
VLLVASVAREHVIQDQRRDRRTPSCGTPAGLVGQRLSRVRPPGGGGHTSGCPRHVPRAEPDSAPPRRCRSCGAAEGEYHNPDRCTDQAALLQQAIDLTQQLVQMKEDEIFVKTGQGRDDF